MALRKVFQRSRGRFQDPKEPGGPKMCPFLGEVPCRVFSAWFPPTSSTNIGVITVKGGFWILANVTGLPLYHVEASIKNNDVLTGCFYLPPALDPGQGHGYLFLQSRTEGLIIGRISFQEQTLIQTKAGKEVKLSLGGFTKMLLMKELLILPMAEGGIQTITLTKGLEESFEKGRMPSECFQTIPTGDKGTVTMIEVICTDMEEWIVVYGLESGNVVIERLVESEKDGGRKQLIADIPLNGEDKGQIPHGMDTIVPISGSVYSDNRGIIIGTTSYNIYKLRLNEGEDQAGVESMKKLQTKGVGCMVIHGDGSTVVVGQWDGTLRILDFKSLAHLKSISFYNAPINSLEFLHCDTDSQRHRYDLLVAASGFPQAFLWDISYVLEIVCLNPL